MIEQPDLFDSEDKKGKVGAFEGMMRAAEHADRVIPNWGEIAIAYLAEYIAELKPERIISPDVRKWARARGLEDPPHERAWGNVFATAARRGLIQFHGFTVYGDAEMHSQSVRVWRVPVAPARRS